MIDLKLTEKEFNLIMGGLMELPAKMSMQLVIKLDEVVKKQVDELEKEKKAPKK